MAVNGEPYDFGRARVVAGIAIIGLVIVLAVIDAADPTYSLDSVQLTLLLFVGCALLGVEAGKRLLG